VLDANVRRGWEIKTLMLVHNGQKQRAGCRGWNPVFYTAEFDLVGLLAWIWFESLTSLRQGKNPFGHGKSWMF